MFKNLSRLDQILIVLSVIGMTALSYLLYDDSFLFRFSSQGTQIVVGQMNLIKNDVRRKASEDFIWITTRRDQDVFRGDSIFTGEESSTLIRLKNGSELLVAENSLIVLEMVGDEFILDLKFGQLESTINNGNLKLKENDQKIQVNSTKSKINIRRNKVGKMDFKLLSGQAELLKTGESKILSENKKIEVEKNQLKEVADYGIENLTPDTFILLGQKPISFAWTSVPEATIYRFLASFKNDLNDPFQNSELNQTSYEFLHPKNNYESIYWKIEAFDSNQKKIAQSDIFKKEITDYKKSSILFPEQNSVVLYQPLNLNDNKTMVQIRWKSTELHKHFSLQLSATEDFEKPTEYKDLIASELEVPLSRGTHFTRVREQNEDLWDLERPWSEIQRFEVKKDASEMNLEIPQFSEIKIDFKPKLKSNGEIDPLAHPKLSWSPIENAIGYELETSTSNDFVQTNKIRVTGTQYSWKKYQLGKFFFRVRAISKFDTTSEASEPAVVSVETNSPQLKPIAPLVVMGTRPDDPGQPQDLQVQWTQVALADSYIVEWDQDPQFSNPKSIESRQPASSIRIEKPGEYNVRVRAIGKNNQPIAQDSPTASLQYILKNPLASPKLLDPLDKMTVFLQENKAPFVWLEWQQVDKATQYDLEISNTSDFKQPVITTVTDKNTFLIRQKIGLGQAYWRVRAKDAEKTSDWSKPRSFTIYSAKNNTRGF